jgi:hypothetical protein
VCEAIKIRQETKDEHEMEGEVLEDHNFAEYPATDTFHDESIARWPAITCSELGSKRIRLVKITPGPPGSTIECEVSTCFLDQAPSYTAISYTWGSPLGFHEILVRGELHSVPKNLWRFLDQARKLRNRKYLTRWLWVDALSIDQSDPQEKLDQVGILSSIFRDADRMVIWLGPSYANSDLALAGVHPYSTTRPRRDSKTLADPVWSALHGLCERPYWRRLWVYQELKSTWGPSLMCGETIVALRGFQEFLLETLALRSADKIDILRTSPAAKILRLIEDPAKISLLESIQETSHLLCTDPRDKAYAILNLVHTGKRGIEADYTITVPVLLNRILRNMHEMSPPKSLRQVVEQCLELERLFKEPTNSIFDTEALSELSRHIDPLAKLASRAAPTEMKLPPPKSLRQVAEQCKRLFGEHPNSIFDTGHINPLEQFASRSEFLKLKLQGLFESRVLLESKVPMELKDLLGFQELLEFKELLTLATWLLSWCVFYSHDSIQRLISRPFHRIAAGERLPWEKTDVVPTPESGSRELVLYRK